MNTCRKTTCRRLRNLILVLRWQQRIMRTSTTTIPNANISACLLAGTVPNNTSGADHLTVWPLSDFTPVEYLPWAMEARPKSETRACPCPSMRMFGLENVRACSVTAFFDCCRTHPLEIPMKHMAIVEIVETFGHVQ